MTGTVTSWIGGWHATTDFFANGNLYIGLGQTTRGGTLTVEANVQRKVISPYTLQGLSAQVTSSTTGANTTALNMRKNGANANATVVLTGSVSGFQRDSTHTDAIVATDLVNLAFAGTSAAPDCFIISTMVDILSAALIPANELTWSALGPTDANSYSLSGSTNTFTQLSGGTAAIGAGETTETDTSKMLVRASATYQGLQATLTTNTSGSTIKFHNNGVTGNQTISPATATGTAVLTQDSTHTDAVISGDKPDYVFNAASHTMNTLWVGCTAIGARSAQDVYVSEQSGTTSVSQTDVYVSTGGSWGTNTNQGQARTPTLHALTVSRLRIHVKSNTQTNGITFLGNTGSVNMTSTISLPAGTTGLFEDTTHSDAIVAFHNINYQFATAAGTGSLIYDWAGSKMDDGSNTGSNTETGTITTTLTGLSQTLTGNDHTSTLTTTLTGVSQSLRGSTSHGTITTTLTGITQHLTAEREEDSTITTRLSGISQSLTGTDITARVTTTLTGISQSLSGNDTSGTITTSLSKLTQSASGGVVHATGTITTALRGVSQHGTVFVAEEFGTIGTHLTGISQRAVVSDLSTLITLRQFWTFGT